ncbi:hypothetical protein BU15DRAFT_74938 [Melanogaster broomeanus]|nr:hypothetical protein BU15DRAFT_74938 [Melanogaster broomeanus]
MERQTHKADSNIVNAGDVLEFLTGGFYKAPSIVSYNLLPTNHVTPVSGSSTSPTPDDSIKLIPLSESPVLQRAGIECKCDDSIAPAAGAWRVARVSAYGSSTLKKSEEQNIEEEVLHGILVKHYN